MFLTYYFTYTAIFFYIHFQKPMPLFAESLFARGMRRQWHPHLDGGFIIHHLFHPSLASPLSLSLSLYRTIDNKKWPVAAKDSLHVLS